MFSRQTPSARLYSLVPPIRGVGELFLGQEVFDLAIVDHEFEFRPAIVNTPLLARRNSELYSANASLAVSNWPMIQLAGDAAPTPMIRKSLIICISLVGEVRGSRNGSTYKPNQVVR